MERDIALEGVTWLLKQGAVVSVLVCDGDTKTLEWIRARGPKAVADVITMRLDLNHVAKCLGGGCRDLKLVSDAACAVIQSTISSCVYWSREHGNDPKPGSPEEAEQAAQLQASCKAAVGHLFNIDGHAACGPSCTAKAGNAAYDPKH